MDWQTWLFQVSWVTLQNRLCGTCSGPRFPPGMKEWLQSLGQRRKPKLPVPKACSPREPVSPDSSPPQMIKERVHDRGSWRGWGARRRGHRKGGGGSGFGQSRGSQTTAVSATPWSVHLTRVLGPSLRASNSVSPGWGVRGCLSNKFPGDRAAPDPGTTLGEAVCYRKVWANCTRERLSNIQQWAVKTVTQEVCCNIYSLLTKGTAY